MRTERTINSKDINFKCIVYLDGYKYLYANAYRLFIIPHSKIYSYKLEVMDY